MQWRRGRQNREKYRMTVRQSIPQGTLKALLKLKQELKAGAK